MRVFISLILILFSFSVVTHAQKAKSNDKVNKYLKKQPLDFELRVEYLKAEDGRILVEFIIEVEK